MRELLQQLIYRQHAAISVSQADSDQLNTDRQNLTGLVLADSSLAKAASQFPNHPIQIVVIGPTQVGKSSVVNMLIGQNLAEASPVAGYTVHCQGFFLSNNENIPESNWLSDIFDGQSLRSQDSLDRELLSEFSITPVQSEAGPLQDMLVWDTPDFDSVDSLSYSVPVLRAIALADLVVLVVSKEKYADKSVWNLLRLLRELNVPLIPVMNKTPLSVREELGQSFRAKFARISGDTASLFFIDDYRDDFDGFFTDHDARELIDAISQTASRRSSKELSESAAGFIKIHWHEWTASLTAEHQLHAQWKSDVDAVCDEAIELYQREYLQHARYKETFQLALAELLALLEVPGIAEPITKLRGVVTWPVRKLREAALSQRAANTHDKDDRSAERRILEELGEHALTQLTKKCAERQANTDYWNTQTDKIASHQHEMLKNYQRGLDSYQILLKGEVERAAQSLYKKLQERPATLNKLRAVRVTADAAAIVLAVKSGGLGAIDLVLAPAMLSLTTMLTEGALGKYMDSVQNDLRIYQQREMAALVNKKLRQRLKSIASDSDSSKTPHISEGQLAETAESLGV